ncbi:MAG: carboxylating nicotinate-nucleotide diphosphorylase [Planctomycetota bacterium]|nr:carboxylating nicotinate-nucleotide diphosphorylase [Planctomycetota bacterium]
MESQNLLDLDQFWLRDDVQRQLLDWIDVALREDRATEDPTAMLFAGSESENCRAVVTVREAGSICGTAAMSLVFERLDSACQTRMRLPDATVVTAGSEILEVEGAAASLFAGERIALNIGAHLSGIATRTARLVKKAGSSLILDTRKTMPGLRLFEKQAVRCGGGVSHREHLAQFPMVKENHRGQIHRIHPELVGDPDAEVTFIHDTLREGGVTGPIAIEVEDEDSFRACLKVGIEVILVDNVGPEQLADWIARARADRLPVRAEQIEASGGIDETTVAAYAAAGAGRISCGAITHSASALDLTMNVCHGISTDDS